MTLKERLRKLVGKGLGVSANGAVRTASVGEPPEMAPLPVGWGETLTGEPMPNVVVAVRRSREGH
jgi:hypothetical protein